MTEPLDDVTAAYKRIFGDPPEQHPLNVAPAAPRVVPGDPDIPEYRETDAPSECGQWAVVLGGLTVVAVVTGWFTYRVLIR